MHLHIGISHVLTFACTAIAFIIRNRLKMARVMRALAVALEQPPGTSLATYATAEAEYLGVPLPVAHALAQSPTPTKTEALK